MTGDGTGSIAARRLAELESLLQRNPPDLTDRLLDLLYDADSAVRSWAMLKLTQIDAELTALPAAKALEVPDLTAGELVRMAQALARVPSVRADGMLAALRHSRHATVRKAATVAIQRRACEELMQPWRRAREAGRQLHASAPEAVTVELIQTATSEDSAALAPVLQRFAVAPSASLQRGVQKAARVALERLLARAREGDTANETDAATVALLTSEVATDRLRGLRMVCASRPCDLVERLVAALADRETGVWHYAANRLRERGRSAVPVLLLAMESSPDRRRHVAVVAGIDGGGWTLSELPGGAVEPVLAALELPDLTVAQTLGLIEAVRWEQAEGLGEAFEELTHSSSPRVRRAAADTSAYRVLPALRSAEAAAALESAEHLLARISAMRLERTGMEVLDAVEDLPAWSIDLEMVRAVEYLNDARVVPLLRRLAGWRGWLAPEKARIAARLALERIEAADAGVPDGALSHAAGPAPPVDDGALSRWRADHDEGDET